MPCHLLQRCCSSLRLHGFPSLLDVLLKLVRNLWISRRHWLWLPFTRIFAKAKGERELKIALAIASCEKAVPYSSYLLEGPWDISPSFERPIRVNAYHDTVTVSQGDNVRTVEWTNESFISMIFILKSHPCKMSKKPIHHWWGKMHACDPEEMG